MSPGAEPIGRDKAGLIALSSASQREAFSTWTTACAPRWTSHLSATLDPRDICLLFFVHLCLPLLFHSFSLAHTVCPPWPTSTAGPPPPPSLPPQCFLVCTSTDRFLFFAGSYVLDTMHVVFPSLQRATNTLVIFSLFPLLALALAGCMSAQPTCRHVRQKSPASRCQTLTHLSVSDRPNTPAEVLPVSRCVLSD